MINKDNLKYPWVTQFIENAKEARSDERVTRSARACIVEGRRLPEVLSIAFSWSDTPQGYDMSIGLI